MGPNYFGVAFFAALCIGYVALLRMCSDRFQSVSKAAFQLHIPDDVGSSIPSDVIARCSGKQAPAAPHRQRLLVAAKKVPKADAEKVNPGTTKTTKPTAKGKAKAKAKTKAKSKKKSASKKAGEKTAYSVAKDAFMKKFLGSIS